MAQVQNTVKLLVQHYYRECQQKNSGNRLKERINLFNIKALMLLQRFENRTQVLFNIL
jgi:hypothetical protein